MTIFIIALGVVAIAFVIWLVAVLRDGRRLRGMGVHYSRTAISPETLRRIIEEVERDDDSTKVYPLGDVPGVEP